MKKKIYHILLLVPITIISFSFDGLQGDDA